MDDLSTTVVADAAGSDPVDSVPPPIALVTLAAQHVLTMYAGAVTVPLLIANALHLSIDDTAYLVSADLFACGIVTLIQTLGLGPIGARLPVIMGVTFVGVTPAITIASDPALGLPGVYGAAIVAGFVVYFLVPYASRLGAVLTPLVTGTAMLLIGLSLMTVAVDWAAGGRGTPDYGGPHHLLLSGFTLAAILLLSRFGQGIVANCAILIGMAAGYAAAAALGIVDLGHVATAPAIGLVSPFHFGAPRVDPIATLSMIVVILVCLVESSGMLMMLGTILGRPLSQRDLARALRADAVGAIVGGVFNSFPYTSYAQNIALVGMTGVRSRFVCAAAGGIMILLALLPKLSALVAAIPPGVLGGAALVLFGMVAASGIRALGHSGIAHSKNDSIVVAVSLGVGIIPLWSDRFFAQLPRGLAPFTHSGMLLGIVTAILLNGLFNGWRRPAAGAA